MSSTLKSRAQHQSGARPQILEKPSANVEDAPLRVNDHGKQAAFHVLMRILLEPGGSDSSGTIAPPVDARRRSCAPSGRRSLNDVCQI
jgi:hypothetical protein